MQVTISPSSVSGNIAAPASKSSMQRACAAALLRSGETIINNPGNADDDLAALGVIRDLGATISPMHNGSISIVSKGVRPMENAINCGESGLGIRMFAPIVALSEKQITINGRGSLLTRPMAFFDSVLPALGVKISSNQGKLPLQLTGPLQPKDILIDGSLSSQFLTGLLMAYAAAGAKGVSIAVSNLKSKPYIDLTLQVMHQFGWAVENRNYESFFFSGDGVAVTPARVEYTVEGDWSGGSFLLVAGAIAGAVNVTGLDLQSTQADKGIMRALEACGAEVSVNGSVSVSAPGTLTAFHFDATDCPDLFPPLVALAAYCKGTTEIKGVTRLAHKESNRALTLQDEFAKMGVEIILQNDVMLVKPGRPVNGAAIHSRHDHRIAMSCAVAALRAKGDTTIAEAQAIGKSYPDFYKHIEAIGATVKYQDTGL